MVIFLVKSDGNLLEAELEKSGLRVTDQVVDGSILQKIGTETFENKSVKVLNAGSFFYFEEAASKAYKLGADYVEISQLQEKSKFLRPFDLKISCVLTMYKLKDES